MQHTPLQQKNCFVWMFFLLFSFLAVGATNVSAQVPRLRQAIPLTDGTIEANKLVDKANGEIKAMQEFTDMSMSNITDYKAALNQGEFKEAKAILDGVVTDIDKGIKHGNTAKDTLDQALRLDISSVFSAYLTLRAASVQARLVSVQKLKEMFQVTSLMLKKMTPNSVRIAQPQIKSLQEQIYTLDKLADDLEERAETIGKKHSSEFMP